MRLPFRKAFAAMRLPPSGCSSVMRMLLPSPQAASMPFLRARSVPGASFVSPSGTARKIFVFAPRMLAAAQGHGISARIWSMICVLLLVQSMGESSRESMGAYVACDSSCGMRWAVPF